MKDLSLIVIVFLLSCGRTPENSVKQNDDAISDTLKKIAYNYLKCWEQPFDAEGSLKSFSQTSDFSLISDAIYVSDYNSWEEVTFISMHHEHEEYISYKHEIEETRCLVLGENSGVISVTYTWHGTDRDGNKDFAKGAITLVCSKEDESWKIVHYHGSHGDDQRKEQ